MVIVVNEEKLSKVLSEFARTLITDFPIQGILDHLVERIVEGPCVTAYESGEAVSVCDLRTDPQYPRFAPAAVSAGLAAVFTFPLRDGIGRLGALDPSRDMPGDLDRLGKPSAHPLASLVVVPAAS